MISTIDKRLSQFFSQSYSSVRGLVISSLQLIRKIAGFSVVNCWARCIRVQPKRILFNSFQGVYCCNPKGITEQLMKDHFHEVEIVWVIRREDNHGIPDGIRTVLFGTLDFYRYLASSKIIVENTIGLQRTLYKKKKCQVLYQTWHGSLGIKRLDGPVVKGIKWKLRRWSAKKDTNYCLSNSDFETQVFQNSYWPGVKTLNYGHARNDVFFDQHSETIAPQIRTLKKNLGIINKKTVLIAPSHYDGESNPFLDYNFPEIVKAFGDKFGGEWVVLFRLHPRYISSSLDENMNEVDCVINVTAVHDMQDLLLIADAGITDFSSWIFDYLLTYKPGFILHQDEDFINYKRGLYFPFETTPFPIASNVSELLSNIGSFNSEDYKIKASDFLTEKGCIDDGEAGTRIAEHILSKVSNDYL
ncbi:CDP-glycerol glycerophosphotransferase family protein [Vibrio splendidus]|uniref:CDP-glycerol glycerophosphotransferase family protein n=1 Tax=Vibrio splendidus TaxID=29497 RepID=UPI000D34665E|nr:CDP-glycerol glycerophosphotransferase family protein [Vibrio splendidus]PTP29407.1 hypothetical protein CWN92_11885 [Vibrio splendidus]